MESLEKNIFFMRRLGYYIIWFVLGVLYGWEGYVIL